MSGQLILNVLIMNMSGQLILNVLIMNMSGRLILNVLIMNIISEEECTLDWSQMIGTCLFYPRGECRGGGRVRDMGCIYSTCDVSVNRNII